MEVLLIHPMALLKWVFWVSLLCSSFGFETLIQACAPNDLLALREFAANLKNGSIVKQWSDASICCSWDGVSCGNGRKVKSLILPKKGLEGSVSRALGSLDDLKFLDLSGNDLRGEVPFELSNLKRLEFLDLSRNKLSGPVSGALSGLKSLLYLNISSNMLNGTVSELQGLSNLVVFNVSNNSLTGQFSSGICSSSDAIRVLDLSMNFFTGGLESLDNCSTSLQQFHADGNSFTGSLPESLYSMPLLEQFSVSMNMLFGELSENLGNLSSLEAFVIYANRFSGSIPNVFGNLTQLQFLVAHSNFLNGTLPPSLALCTNLTVLDLRNNSLTGPIDLNFTGLPNLCNLDLATNHFNGSLPDSLSSCRKLKILSLAKNGLSGEVPKSFNELTSLSFLSLSNNSFVNLSMTLSVLQQCKNLTTLILTENFHGEEFPENVGGFESLMVLALGNCGLKGKIPVWLLKCMKLEVLDLSWNKLDGNIPNWVGEMEHLFYLDFSNNSLTGEIPKSLTELKSLISSDCCSFTDLTSSAGVPLYVKRNQSARGLQYNQVSSFPPSVYLSNNRLHGTIWPEIGRLKQLHVLDLSKNNISGTIPGNISEMKNLEVLDLSSNDLVGSIPDSLIKLTFLSKFSVANNHLQGAIPNGGQFLSFPAASFDGNPGLCRDLDSPCEKPGPMMLKPRVPPDSKFGRSTIIGITISIAVGMLLLLGALLFRMSRNDDFEDRIEDFEYEHGSPRRASDALGPSKLVFFENSLFPALTVLDLLKSTNYFNQANIIGCGGFGLVYKAILPNGTKSAVKRLSGDCGQMEREFQAEVEALSRAQHKNLVSLQGYCKHGNDRLLIYSYMENGSLDYWLHENDDHGSELNWEVRLRIAQGAARGLAYLHKACEPSIVHRDVKSSNILLDERFEAHLADFGLSRLLHPYDTHVTTDLVGTLGYIPPEYSQTLTATFKGDVYSFGVVLLELLTRRRPVEVCKGKNCRDLVSWVFQMRSEKREEEIIDPSIWERVREKQILEVLSIACRCIDQDPRKRPPIDVVVSWLEGIGFSDSRSSHLM